MADWFDWSLLDDQTHPHSLGGGGPGLGGAPAPQTQNTISGGGVHYNGNFNPSNNDEGQRLDDMIRPMLSGMATAGGVGSALGMTTTNNNQRRTSAGEQLLLQKSAGLQNSGDGVSIPNGATALLAQSPSLALLPPTTSSSLNFGYGGGSGATASSLECFVEASSQAFAATAAAAPPPPGGGVVDLTTSGVALEAALGNTLAAASYSSALAAATIPAPVVVAKVAPLPPPSPRSPAYASKKRKPHETNGGGSASPSAVDDQLIQFIMRLHSDAGSTPNSDGFLPIHLACLHFPRNAKLIGTMLATNPDVARRRVAAKEAAVRRRRSSLSVHSHHAGEEDEASRLAKRSKFLNGARGGGGGGGGGFGGPRHPAAASGTGAGGADGDHPYDGCYPLHVALANGAPIPVVRLLVRRAPDVLTRTNAAGAVPLSVAFKAKGGKDGGRILDYEDVILFLLGVMGPSAASACVPDGRMNTPLHHACMSRGGSGRGSSNGPLSSAPQAQGGGGAPSLAVLQALVRAAGHGGLLARNFNGMTPLDLAQSSGTRFGDEEISYLQEAAYGEDANLVQEPPV